MFTSYIYQFLYLHIIILLSLLGYIKLHNKNHYYIIGIVDKSQYAFLWALFFIIFLAFRPITAAHGLGDTFTYNIQYEQFKNGSLTLFDFDKELVFNGLMYYCSKYFSINIFFLITLSGYIGFMLWGCKRLFVNNAYFAFLFCIGAFSFFPYGVNGIRNGLATSVIILAISFFQGNKINFLFAFLLLIGAYNIHSTSFLPSVGLLIVLFYSNTRVYLWFWVLSIFISLSAGGIIENIFISLGFDDRLTTYITTEDFNDSFSSIGFRWDFLLYSVIPIVLGWYCVVKRKIFNTTYLLLLNTYIVCNAFWIMVIQAAFSNRFAYLSWFLYPLVLAYPLLKFPLWRLQGQKTGLFLLGHSFFTYIMWVFKG